MNDEAVILVVDDRAQNIRLLDAVLTPAPIGCLTANPAKRLWIC